MYVWDQHGNLVNLDRYDTVTLTWADVGWGRNKKRRWSVQAVSFTFTHMLLQGEEAECRGFMEELFQKLAAVNAAV